MKKNKNIEEVTTSKKYLFERYKKYWPLAHSFNEIKEEMLPLKRVAVLLDEYFLEKMKEVSKANIKNIQEGP